MANTDGTAMANGLAVRDYATTADPVPREREPSSLESKAAGPSMKALGKKREIVVQQPVAVKKAVVQAQPAPERRSTRSSNVAASSKETDASDDEDGLDDGPLLPPYQTLLFTTQPSESLVSFDPPVLPATLQHLIEVPECKLLDETSYSFARARRQHGQQVDTSDLYYLKKHTPGETLERRARKQEKDRLAQERNTLRARIEQLKTGLASSAYYASASPVKGANGRLAPAAVSDRVKDSERVKIKQLHEAEEMLMRYNELLEPRVPFKQSNGTVAPGSNASRPWTAGGKGIPPPPEGVAASDFSSQSGPIAAPSAASVAQRKLAAARTGAAGAAGTKSRSASPANAIASAPMGRSSSTRAARSTSSTVTAEPSVLPFRAIRPAPGTSIAASEAGLTTVAPSNKNGYASSNGLPDRATGKRGHRSSAHPGPLKPSSIVAQTANPGATDVHGSSLPPSPTRKKKRKKKERSSEDDDGRKEAIAYMDATAQAAEAQATAAMFLHPGYRVDPSESQDDTMGGETETDVPSKYRKKRIPIQKVHHPSEEIEHFWEYRGRGAGPPSPPSKASRERDAYRYGASNVLRWQQQKVNQLHSAHLSAGDATRAGTPIPGQVPPSITISAVPGTVTAGPATAPAASLKFLRNGSRSSTPIGLQHQRRRAPRNFRSTPQPPDKSAAEATHRVSSTLQRVANAFNSDDDLSSVSSGPNDEYDDDFDFDNKFRNERATKVLDKHDTTFPIPLDALRGTQGVIDSRVLVPTVSRASTPELTKEETVYLPISGLRVRRRAKLDDFPVNELDEVDIEHMTALRRMYTWVRGSHREAGVPEHNKPFGEWQVVMPSSFIRGPHGVDHPYPYPCDPAPDPSDPTQHRYWPAPVRPVNGT